MSKLLSLTLGAVFATACSSGSSATRSDTDHTLMAQHAWGAGANGTDSGLQSLQTVTGAVADVRSDSLTVHGMALKVDSRTEVVRTCAPVENVFSAIREGDQIHASYDPARHRATRIETGPGIEQDSTDHTLMGQQAWGAGSNATGSGLERLNTVSGTVATVRSDGLTVHGMALKVDSRTEVVRTCAPVGEVFSAIREGDQARARYDPAKNRATRIEVGPGIQPDSRGRIQHQGSEPRNEGNEGNDLPAK